MKPDDALTVSIAHDPRDIEKAISSALTEVALDDFRDQVGAIKPNDTTSSGSARPIPTPRRKGIRAA